MKNRNRDRKGAVTICPLSIGHISGLLALQLFAVLSVFDLRLAIIPLVLFVGVALAAPFFPQLHFFLPVYRRGKPSQAAVGLTFDDGPDPQTTPMLLSLLKAFGYQATFFVNGDKVRRYPDLITDILAAGHEIGNHSDTHDSLIMLKGYRALAAEISACNRSLEVFGIRPLAFRPPVGITNPHLFRVLVERGMFCAGFSCRAADFGNRRLKNLSVKIRRKMRIGDVVLLHEGIPGDRSDTNRWEKEVRHIFMEIQRRHWSGIAMSAVIQKPVMKSLGNSTALGNIAGFYDGLAPDYDREQESGGQRRLRGQEEKRVLQKISQRIRSGDRVLEIGAGTGRLTIPLAEAAASVVAVDASQAMLTILKKKAARRGIANIEFVHADIRALEGFRKLDAVFAVSSLEYIPDLADFLCDIHKMLRPGGVLCLTIARRSALRIAVQIGNAMRQGLWLHAWSEREMAQFLTRAGYTAIEIVPFGLQSFFCRGILMEVVAMR